MCKTIAKLANYHDSPPKFTQKISVVSCLHLAHGNAHQLVDNAGDWLSLKSKSEEEKIPVETGTFLVDV